MVKLLHTKGNQLRFKAAFVAGRVITAGYHFHLAAVALEVLQHHPVNIDCPEVVFEDGDLLALCEQVGGILADEGGFPSPKNASNEVDCGHRASSFLRLIITKNRRKCNAKNGK